VKFPAHIWNQLKNLTADEIIHALEKDEWIRDRKRGAEIVYRHPDGRRVVIHYHPGKTYGPKLLKNLIKDIGWSEKDFKRLKLIK
jgi:predicted RNA binding protein YcfA (HicA-like mRNA interferase family)